MLNDKEWDSQLLIIKGDKVFKISNFFCVSESEGYEVVHNNNLIVGALAETVGKDPVDRILSAIRFANRMMNREYFPLTIFDSKTKRKKVYYK